MSQLVIKFPDAQITGDVIPTVGIPWALGLKWSFGTDLRIHWLGQIRILILRWLPPDSLSEGGWGRTHLGKS